MGNDYSIASGLNPGDKVIVSGTQFLVNGMPVILMGAASACAARAKPAGAEHEHRSAD